jgi:NADPH-dependent glutamate synthase beta subunit-like oxidoreductase
MTSGPERERRLDAPVVFHSLAEMPPLPVSLGTTLTNHTGTWRYIRPYYQDRTPPCNHACPAGSDIVHWLAALAEGDDEAAWRLLVTENPLPGVCGRVCPHPCEVECNRREFGGAIAIHALERYLADEASHPGGSAATGESGDRRRRTGGPVMCLPSGAARLCAYDL